MSGESASQFFFPKRVQFLLSAVLVFALAMGERHPTSSRFFSPAMWNEFPSFVALPDSDSIKRPQKHAEEIKLLDAKFYEIEREIDQLKTEKLKLIHQICTLERADFKRLKTPSKIHMVAFVDKIEEGILYLQLKEFVNKCDIIKYDTYPDGNFLNNVLRKQQGMEQFATMEEDHLYQAMRITQLRIDNLPKFQEEYIRNKRSQWPEWGKGAEFTKSEKGELEVRFPTESSASKVVDSYVVTNYFASLVYKVFEGDYVISDDPAVELRKLMKTHPLIYENSEIISDDAGLMAAYAGKEPPAMGSDINEMYTKALDKYKGFVEMFKARGMTGAPSENGPAYTFTSYSSVAV